MTLPAKFLLAAVVCGSMASLFAPAHARFGNQPITTPITSQPLFGNHVTPPPVFGNHPVTTTTTPPLFGNQPTTTVTSTQPLFGNNVTPPPPALFGHSRFGG